MQSTKANNRTLTVAGANKVFGVIKAEFWYLPELGIYECAYLGMITQHRTLTEACQALVRRLAQ